MLEPPPNSKEWAKHKGIIKTCPWCHKEYDRNVEHVCPHAPKKKKIPRIFEHVIWLTEDKREKDEKTQK